MANLRQRWSNGPTVIVSPAPIHLLPGGVARQFCGPLVQVSWGPAPAKETQTCTAPDGAPSSSPA